MKKIILMMIPSLLFITCFAQQKPAPAGRFTISGTIKSKSRGETLIGASIRSGNTGTLSNEYGFYSLTLEKGNHTIEFSAIGMQNQTLQIALESDSSLNIFLEDEIKNLEGVIVSAQSKGRSISSPQMGVEKLSTKEIRNIPVLLGERDILKTIQLLPGI
ncbi:MAG: carboxypeptidase-like regulatory domain-containing protein, partial [Bacteroidota bacterium]|nr:carboxypeptidase-like regulatory domain-containing protein [Bacteroidota bacterium]